MRIQFLYHPTHAVSRAARARSTVAMRRRVDRLEAALVEHVDVARDRYVHGALSEILVLEAEADVVEAYWEAGCP